MDRYFRRLGLEPATVSPLDRLASMPWLRAHLGAYTPMAIIWGAVALGLGMVFVDTLFTLLRCWSDAG